MVTQLSNSKLQPRQTFSRRMGTNLKPYLEQLPMRRKCPVHPFHPHQLVKYTQLPQVFLIQMSSNIPSAAWELKAISISKLNQLPMLRRKCPLHPLHPHQLVKVKYTQLPQVFWIFRTSRSGPHLVQMSSSLPFYCVQMPSTTWKLRAISVSPASELREILSATHNTPDFLEQL